MIFIAYNSVQSWAYLFYNFLGSFKVKVFNYLTLIFNFLIRLFRYSLKAKIKSIIKLLRAWLLAFKRINFVICIPFY